MFTLLNKCGLGKHKILLSKTYKKLNNPKLLKGSEYYITFT